MGRISTAELQMKLSRCLRRPSHHSLRHREKGWDSERHGAFIRRYLEMGLFSLFPRIWPSTNLLGSGSFYSFLRMIRSSERGVWTMLCLRRAMIDGMHMRWIWSRNGVWHAQGDQGKGISPRLFRPCPLHCLRDGVLGIECCMLLRARVE